MDTVRIFDHLMSAPSAPLALADPSNRGWELLTPRPRRRLTWLLASAAGFLLVIAGARDVDEDVLEIMPRESVSGETR
ncbi:MAG TPA: hypothetical protein VF950_30735 [Planctomycetota bacterium]